MQFGNTGINRSQFHPAHFFHLFFAFFSLFVEFINMLVDFEAGRPMEVEAILGNPICTAKRHKVAVPYMESLYGLLKLVDKKIRTQKS